MPYTVRLTRDAARDLEELYEFIADRDGARKANGVLDRIEGVLNSLSETPERGNHPKELAALGIREYRQVYFKPYRVIYRVMDATVYVFLIADGRRDMRSLLERRLLEVE